MSAGLADLIEKLSAGALPVELTAERDARGRFVVGNAGGPGRPARAVELSYLRALSDELTLEDWRAIVRRAIEQAKAGDAGARAWVTKHALGHEPPALSDLALREVLGVSEAHELTARAESSTGGLGFNWKSELERAAELAEQERAEQERERKREARRIRQAERQAQAEQAGPGETPAAAESVPGGQ